ncbi:hypothetical protein M422DRAFT_64778 [Sphaerobolus stellatus SS14]|nr:hypothetical protein M422DRAFT_64778 [Sphaerobolus stellatus SS14]
MAASDSDIQFLGNWSSNSPASTSTFVSAIVLTPVKPDNSGCDTPLTFSREASSVVHVGRNMNETACLAVDKAAFTSPVMSRSHAKITFADSGSVFIIDTGSYHGTWVARASDKCKLEPETPFQLRDGDILTMGKEVFKDGNLHQPITVSVKLLHSNPSASPMSISTGSLPPEIPYISPKPRNTFGLHTTTDEDASSDGESQDSDFESNPHSPERDSPPTIEAAPIDIITGQNATYSPGSPSTGSNSSSSEADNEPEQLADLFPTSPSLVLPVTPPWRQRLPSLSSEIFRRFGPKSPRGPSAVGRFERLFSSRSSRGEDILSPEARVSDVAHEDLERIAHPGNHHHAHAHHAAHHHCHNHHAHAHHSHEQFVPHSTGSGEVSKVSERIDELVKDVQSLKENSVELNMLRNSVTTVEEKLKDSLTPIENDIVTLKSHKSGIQTDIRFLRADLESRGAEIEAVRYKLENRVDDAREQAIEVQASLESVQDDLVSMKEGMNETSSDVTAAQMNIGQLENKVSELITAVKDIEAFRVHSESAMKDFRAETEKAYEQLSEKIKLEVNQLLEEYRATNVLGKRKRSDDDEDSADLKEDGSVHRGLIPKRARHGLVSKFVTASAVGAVGAWLGLAYL